MSQQQQKVTGLQKLVLVTALSPLLFLRWILHRFPSEKRSFNPKAFQPPAKYLVRLASLPFRLLNPPTVHGLEHVIQACQNGERIILVGNQNTFPCLDQVVLMSAIYVGCNTWLRNLVDAIIGKVSLIRDLMEAAGIVIGTKRNCDDLMAAGEPVLFYPGGLSETFKTSDQEPYTLQWGDRLGFVYLAIKHNYTFIPFSSIGLENALWVPFRIPLQPLFSLLGETRPPIAFPILLPYNTFERQYIRFGQPIRTSQYQGAFENQAFSREVFQRLYASVNRLIEEALLEREEDASRYISGRVWLRFKALVMWILGVLGWRGKGGKGEKAGVVERCQDPGDRGRGGVCKEPEKVGRSGEEADRRRPGLKGEEH